MYMFVCMGYISDDDKLSTISDIQHKIASQYSSSQQSSDHDHNNNHNSNNNNDTNDNDNDKHNDNINQSKILSNLNTQIHNKQLELIDLQHQCQQQYQILTTIQNVNAYFLIYIISHMYMSTVYMCQL